MKNVLIVGGTSGVGLAIAQELLRRNAKHIYLVGKVAPCIDEVDRELKETFIEKTEYIYTNLADGDYSIFDEITDIDTLVISAGFGRVAPFESLLDIEIDNLIKVNLLAIIRIVKRYYDRIRGEEDFYCAVMGSIAGHVVSPLFSVYGASKSGVCGFIENINSELYSAGCSNRVLDVSPGVISGTRFAGGTNNMHSIAPLAKDIVDKMLKKERIYIPLYEEVYKGVLERYYSDPVNFGKASYEHKIEQKRIDLVPRVVTGYLSGTFDLFHVGHLNLLKRAKEQCDFLIVGVHLSGAWKNKETYIPYNERVAILESTKYVDKVVESCAEDSDAWELYKYDKLFVGDDYKGSARFLKYEQFFEDKGVEIVYFPYTKGTSSTQLRGVIGRKLEER